MIVNGAPIRFQTKSRIELTAKARFLFGKQIMPPDQVDSPARRIYFALQSTYMGNEKEYTAGLESTRHFISEFQSATTCDVVRLILDEALLAAEADDCYKAMKLVRRVIQFEDAVLGKTPTVAVSTANSDRYAKYEACHPGL
jgi:flagellar biosynthesis repressor protein FlbT